MKLPPAVIDGICPRSPTSGGNDGVPLFYTVGVSPGTPGIALQYLLLGDLLGRKSA